MQNMVNISFVPSGNKQFIDDVSSYWKRQFEDSVPEWTPQRVTYDVDGTRRIPWALASEIMKRQAIIFKQVNGGGR